MQKKYCKECGAEVEPKKTHSYPQSRREVSYEDDDLLDIVGFDATFDLDFID